MHLPRHAPLATEQLGSAIGQDFVHIHIGLGTGAGLPDRQRKLFVMETGEHFVGGADDRLGNDGVKQAELAIDHRTGPLGRRQGVNQGARHALGGNLEMRERPLCLRSPQGRGGHLDDAERIAFVAVCAVHADSLARSGRLRVVASAVY